MSCQSLLEELDLPNGFVDYASGLINYVRQNYSLGRSDISYLCFEYALKKSKRHRGLLMDGSSCLEEALGSARRLTIVGKSVEIDPVAVEEVLWHKTDAEADFITKVLKYFYLARNLRIAQLERVVEAFVPMNVVANQVVIRQGDQGDKFYIVESGKFEVTKDGKRVNKISRGGYFGEIALLYESPRTASVRAVTSGRLWWINQVQFKSRIVAVGQQYNSFYQNILENNPFFKGMDDNTREQLVNAIEQIIFEDGECIVKHGGKDFDSLYFIESGQVRITIDGKQRSPPLKRGYAFGRLLVVDGEDSTRAVVPKVNSR
ncbi:hypothetical protein ACOME3_001931 [Neoechinorhynchus agilis]